MDTSKIIKGAVSSGRYTVTAPIVKEDYGLYLQIEGIELPSTYEVDFSNNENSGTSVTMIGNADGVLIPRQFIDSGKDVFAFLYHVGQDFGRTVYKFRIPNKLRPDRTEDTPTPEEQSVIDQAISALNEAVEQTAQDVESADQSAQSAQGYAEQAETARDTAQGYSNNAQTSANNASASAQASANSATASAQSASQSAQIKADVEGMVDDAQASAGASAQSATASATSATQAQGYAQSASASAQSASTSASAALTYANTASQKATEASTSAQTASTKATEASQSASQALSYKNDAESAKTASQTAQGLAESARDTAVSAKTDAESARDDAVQAKTDVQNIADGIDTRLVDVESALIDKAPAITDTASGSIASFSDGADDLPLKSLVVDINPIQDLSHGDPSPENICPISGWTEANVIHCGKDLLAPTAYKGEYNGSSGTDLKTASPASYEYTNTGVIVNASAWGGRLFATPPLPAGTYFVHSDAITGNPRCSLYITNSNLVVTSRIKNIGGSGERFNNSVTLTENGQRIAVEIMSSVSDNLLVPALQCEVGSVYTPYVPHIAPESIPISWQSEAGTVYGGKLDVLSGVLTVNRAMVDLGTLNWTYNNIYNRFLTSALIAIIKPSDNAKKGNIVCSLYKTETANHTADPAYDNAIGVGSTGTIVIKDTSYTDATAFKAMLTANNAQLVYELQTPITIQLTPNQVNSLLGVNNLWADSGDTEVEYRADTKAWVQRKIAEAIASLT